MNIYFLGNFLFRIFLLTLCAACIHMNGMGSAEEDFFPSPTVGKKLESAHERLVTNVQDDRSVEPYFLFSLTRALEVYRKETNKLDSFGDLKKVLQGKLFDTEIRCCRLRTPSPSSPNPRG